MGGRQKIDNAAYSRYSTVSVSGYGQRGAGSRPQQEPVYSHGGGGAVSRQQGDPTYSQIPGAGAVNRQQHATYAEPRTCRRIGDTAEYAYVIINSDVFLI